MEDLSIIGPNYLDKARSSDYKNSVYAIAEILDNSIDAEAKNIEILTVTKDKSITDIYFIDDGKGMNEDKLQKCVIFSETNNIPGSGKTGFFGFGLPNSSLSQCAKFSVLTKINGKWKQNEVDFKKMKADVSLKIKPIFDANVDFISKIISMSEINNPRTIVHWNDLDRIDTNRAKTLNDRTERLIGRIHRYNIRKGLKIRFLNYSDDNPTPDINHVFVENDPLFQTTGNSWISPIIYELSKEKSNPNPLFSLDTYFKKFTIQGDKNRVKPLFYLPEDAQDQIVIKWHGKTYCIDLILAVAYRDVQKPGRREGGRTTFGQQLGIKVRGTSNYPSGNISWVRNDREITTGNYSLFNVTQENQRFWSIELNYNTHQNNDNVIDELLGLSNSKQSIKFNPDKDFPDDLSQTASINDKKQELIAEITNKINGAIQKANKKLSAQAREWKRIEELEKGGSGNGGIPGPDKRTYSVLLDALGKGEQLNEEEQKNLVSKLKQYLPNIAKSNIIDAVQRFSDIGLKNIIIYCEIDERDLIQTDRYSGKNITLINVKHNFYTQVIEPLKEKNEHDLLASIELLLSSISRTGQNAFFENQYEIIKEFYELMSKDLKLLLTKQKDVHYDEDEDEDEEEDEDIYD